MYPAEYGSICEGRRVYLRYSVEGGERENIVSLSIFGVVVGVADKVARMLNRTKR